MTPRLRCAIYTRKSTEEGLEQEFNSLDAQRQSCEAYIASQRSLGWACLPARYDDGGISGGTMERPALQRLLADIKANRVDLIVVYKIDRLTRSLTDFAKLVEVFEAHSVSFVSVTQQFNTTTSMGRLTLNVLLSFAQFEREVTGERIRDKIAASKRKGMWMGGTVPLGYDLHDRKLVINEAEAQMVRTLYRLYLRLGTVKALTAEAGRLRFLTKRRQHRDGRESGGQPFTRGHLYWLLRNPIYVGEIAHRGSRHPGQHPAIIDHETFEAVECQLQANAAAHRAQVRGSSPSLLTGLVYDETGDRLCPTHARKEGRRYRYYISKRLMHRSPGVEGGWRLPARSFEDLVIKVIATFLCDELHIVEALGASGIAPQRLLSILEHLRASASRLTGHEPTAYRDTLERLVHRITLRNGTLEILIKRASLLAPCAADDRVAIAPAEPHYELSVPFTLQRRGVEAKLIIGSTEEAPGQIDEKLQALVAAAHSHLQRLVGGEIGSVKNLALAEKIDPSDVGRSLQVAFLAPDIVDAIIEGRQPVELTAWQLRRIGYLPLAWEEQRRLLGFPASRS